MSGFSSRVSDTIPWPNDPNHSVYIRKLARKPFERAAKRQSANLIADLREQFGEDWQQTIKNFKTDDKSKELKEAAKDPLLQFDVDTLLKYGVKSWTHEDMPLNQESLDDLDKFTADTIARAILKLCEPALFDSYPGESRKNDSEPSGTA